MLHQHQLRQTDTVPPPWRWQVQSQLRVTKPPIMFVFTGGMSEMSDDMLGGMFVDILGAMLEVMLGMLLGLDMLTMFLKPPKAAIILWSLDSWLTVQLIIMLFSLIIEVFHVLQRVELSFQTPNTVPRYFCFTVTVYYALLCVRMVSGQQADPRHGRTAHILVKLLPLTGIGITCLTALFSHSASAVAWPVSRYIVHSLVAITLLSCACKKVH